jgi:hypothetical protein
MVFVPFALAFVALYLGTMGFSRGGIPWSKDRNITGKAGRIVGTFCLVLGAALLAAAFWVLAGTFEWVGPLM